MDKKSTIPHIIFSVGVLAFTMSQAHADEACDAEVATIQTVLDAPSSSINTTDLEQAQMLFSVLSEDCAGGTPLETAAPMAQAIRTLLGMEAGS